MWLWVSSLWPSQGLFLSSQVEKALFLFNSEPRHVNFCLLHYFVAFESKVCVVWHIPICSQIRVAKHHDVVLTSERVLLESHWLQDYFRVMSFCLVGRRSVLVPNWTLVERSYCLRVVQHFCLASNVQKVSSEPYLFSKYMVNF